jgi:glutamyl-tRNA synthetase
MALEISAPEGSFEGKLLHDAYGKDPKFKWVSSKDLSEPHAIAPSGEVFKGVPSIVRHIVKGGEPDHNSHLDVWTRKTLNVDEVVDNADLVNHQLQLRTFISGHHLSLVDIVVRDNFKSAPKWSEVATGKTTPHLLRWIAHLDSLPQLGGKSTKAAKSEASKGISGWRGNYDSLPGATEGNVVTRFPPEPSGYLHIGHIKAAMLNSHYANLYKGRLILRFDDTNPAKEKDDFVDNIKADLADVGITFQSVSYTSDYFDVIEKYAVQLLKSGNAFIDDTPLEQMRSERRTAEGTEGIESKCRNQTVEENLKLFEEMKEGSPTGLKCVMRAKIDMKSKNAVLRDPSLYRCSVEPHYKTGTKYKAYPLYDFACPIVDSIEGVTHALRSSEYHDRNALYDWVLDALKLRKVHIEDFSRLNFKYVLLSKRMLQKFVNRGIVEGWNDPRFPTVQGIFRRGMTLEALREFILGQGASKALNLMDMDKLWAINKKLIDPVVPRYTVVDSARVPLKLTNSPGEATFKSVPRHKKNPELGNKVVIYHNHLFIDANDAKQIKDNEEITLMDWGNAIVRTFTRDSAGNVTSLEAELNLQGDFKSTEKKITWLADSPDLVPVVLRKYGYLITKEKLEEGDDIEDYINPNSLVETTGYGDPALRTLNAGDRIQLERKGYYIVDSPFMYPNKPLVLVLIPDGAAEVNKRLIINI